MSPLRTVSVFWDYLEYQSTRRKYLSALESVRKDGCYEKSRLFCWFWQQTARVSHDSSPTWVIKFSVFFFCTGRSAGLGAGVSGEGWLADEMGQQELVAGPQLPCWQRCGDTLQGQLQTPSSSWLFLPPWRSVSMTKSNFGPRSGGMRDVPHSMPGPVLVRISFKRRATRWSMTAASRALGAGGWGATGGDVEARGDSPGRGADCTRFESWIWTALCHLFLCLLGW